MAYSNKGYESFYSGSYGPLEPGYGDLFTGYRADFSRLGSPTSIQTSNQITEVSSRLNEGIKAVELQPISQGVFEGIPKQHFKEAERLGKLTGARFSMHAPLIDPAGFSGEGRWSETARQEAELRTRDFIDKAHILDPKGNTPIVMHATGAGVPSSEWRKINGERTVQTIMVVDRDTGALAPVEREERVFPEKITIEAKDAIRMKNATEWDKHTLPLIEYKKEADKLIESSWRVVEPQWNELAEERAEGQKKIMDEFNSGRLKDVDAMNKMNELNDRIYDKVEPELKPYFGKIQMAQEYYGEIDKHISALYDKAYKYVPGETDEEKKKIREFIGKMAKKYREAKSIADVNPAAASRVYSELISGLRNVAPESFITTEQFALEKSKETIANSAIYAYKKYGDSAPIIALENFFPGTVFSKGDELAALVKASRAQFVESAMKSGISESEARRAAEKLIGATWDVGHINLMRKSGFTKEDIVQETKKIAPFVKHVHLTDNFGYEDSHLPPGMGEVPIKEMMKELEKAGFSGREIVEAGGFAAGFKASPTQYVLEALGSPMYSMQMQPYWNQIKGSYGIPAPYSSGYGLMLPEQHFSIYGSGFSTLPTELGGQMPGKGQRFSGAPME